MSKKRYQPARKPVEKVLPKTLVTFNGPLIEGEWVSGYPEWKLSSTDNGIFGFEEHEFDP